MDRAYSSGASASPPTAPASPSVGYPTAGNAGGGTLATKPGPWWFHMITEEMLAVIVAGGITPAHGTLTQLKAALDALYAPKGSGGSAVQGSFKNLQLSATGTNASVVASADEIVVEDGSNAYKTLRAVALTINSASAGANGLDTGAIAASTWYSVWVIAKADGTTAGLLSLSATAPTLPSGYTFKARVGWVRTDGTANKFPLKFLQYGRRVAYSGGAGTNLTTSPIMASGSSVAVNTAVAVANFVPPTACAIELTLVGLNLIGPSQWVDARTNPATQKAYFSGENSAQGGNYGVTFRALLEGANVYWGVISTGTSSLICQGWEDNI